MGTGSLDRIRVRRAARVNTTSSGAVIRAVALGLVPLPALAACPQETYLACPVGEGRYLEVCIGANAFTYAFGPLGKPELTLSVSMAAGTVTPWPGIGRAIWSSVGFPNEGYTYEAWSSVDRDPDNVNPQGGVNVLQGDAMLAQFTCLPGTVDSPAFVLEDAMAAAGYCWNYDQRAWSRGNCG